MDSPQFSIHMFISHSLSAAAERNLPRIDESLFFELFSPSGPKPHRNHTKSKKEN